MNNTAADLLILSTSTLKVNNLTIGIINFKYMVLFKTPAAFNISIAYTLIFYWLWNFIVCLPGKSPHCQEVEGKPPGLLPPPEMGDPIRCPEV
jgi:hypothetical protein